MSPFDGTHVRLFASARPSEHVHWERIERVEARSAGGSDREPAPPARRGFRLAWPSRWRAPR